MPESPEVDALTQFLRETLAGGVIGVTDLVEFRALKTRATSLTELTGHTVRDVTRHGKHIAVTTDAPVLVISFGRAGWAAWTPAGEASAPAPDAPTIATIDVPGRGVLALTDAGAWLSLGVSVVADPTEVAAIAKLGPDPAAEGYAPADLDAVLMGRRKQLKALLQEQESIAGIGNAYSDEILHVARLNPLAHAASLEADERARLYEAVRAVLSDAFRARRSVPISEQKAAKVAAMRVHGRAGEPCPVCGGDVLDVPGSKGAAQYCPTCQTGGVELPG